MVIVIFKLNVVLQQVSVCLVIHSYNFHIGTEISSSLLKTATFCASSLIRPVECPPDFETMLSRKSVGRQSALVGIIGTNISDTMLQYVL